MKKYEYDCLQARMKRKLKHESYTGNKKEAYQEGVLACMSILSSEFNAQQLKKGSGESNGNK